MKHKLLRRTLRGSAVLLLFAGCANPLLTNEDVQTQQYQEIDASGGGSFYDYMVQGALVPPRKIRASKGTSETEILLEWSGVTGAEGYRVYRSDKKDGEYALATNTLWPDGKVTTTLFKDTRDIIPGRDYFYKILTLYPKEKTSSLSSPVLGYTDAGTLPKAPSGLTVTMGKDSNCLILSWSPVEGAVDYEVLRYKGKKAESGWTFPESEFTVAGSRILEISYFDYFSPEETAFHYQYSVRAYNQAGLHGRDSTVLEGFLPEVPSQWKVSEGASKPRYEEVYVTWSGVPDSSGYRVYRSDTKTGPWIMLTETDGESRTFTDRTTVPYTKYYYAMTSLLGGSESMKTPPIKGYSVDSNAPAPPTNVYPTRGLHSFRDSIHISWDEVQGATDYKVYRSSTLIGNYSFLEKTQAAYFDDNSVDVGKRYYYKITSRQKIGETTYEGGPSVPREGYTLLAPVALKATVNASAIEVSWDPITSEESNVGADYFRLFRAGLPTDGAFDSDSAEWTDVSGRVANPGTPGTRVSFLDDSVNPGTPYVYRACSYLSEEELSAYSGELRAVTLAAPVLSVPQIFTDKVGILWPAVEGAQNYRIVRKDPVTQTFAPLTTLSAKDHKALGGGVFLDDSDAARSGKPVSYKVAADYGGDLVSGFSSEVTAHSLIPPGEFSASRGAFEKKIVLVWKASTGAEAYKIIRRKHGDEGSWFSVEKKFTGLRLEDTAVILRKGVTYDYRIFAIEGELTTKLPGETQGFIAEDGALLPPTITATQGTEIGKVGLTWDPVPSSDGFSIRYYITKSLSLTGESVGVNYTVNEKTGEKTLLPSYDGGTAFEDTTPEDGTVYYYRVEAEEFKDGKTRRISAPSDFCPGFSLGCPTGVTASDATPKTLDGKTGILVTWNPVPGAHHYGVFRTEPESEAPVEVGTDLTNPTFLDVPGEDEAGKTFLYTVKSFCSEEDTAGRESSADEGYILKAPEKVEVSRGTSRSGAEISWPRGPGAAYYRIYRSETENGSYEKVNGKIYNSETAPDGGRLTYVDNTGVPGKVYWYKVRQYLDDSRYSGLSSAVSGFMLGIPGEFQAAGSGSVSSTGTEVTLSWKTEMFGPTLAFEILRTGGKDGPRTFLKPISETEQTDYSCVDSTVNPGTPYKYAIRAIYGAGDEAVKTLYSGTRTAKAKLAAPEILSVSEGSSETSIHVTWKALDGADFYNLYRRNEITGQINRVNGEIFTTQYTDKGEKVDPRSSLIYSYYVKGYNSDGVGGEAGPFISGCLKPKAPQLHSVSTGEAAKVTLKWEPIPFADTYEIYRSNDDGETFGLLKTVAGSSFTDSADTISDASAKITGINYCGLLKYKIRARVALNGGSIPGNESQTLSGYRKFANPGEIQYLIGAAVDSAIASIGKINGSSSKPGIPAGYYTDTDSREPGLGSQFYMDWDFTGYTYKGMTIDDTAYRFAHKKDDEKAFRDSADFGDYYGDWGHGDDYRKGKIDYNFQNAETGTATVNNAGFPNYDDWESPDFQHTIYSLKKNKSQL